MSSREDEIKQRVRAEFEPPYDIMLDPSLLVAENALESVANSSLFDARAQTTLKGDMDPIISDIYVPQSFVRLLEESSQFDLRKTEAWTYFLRQSRGAFPEDILNLIERRNLRPFSVEEANVTPEILDQLDWENALGNGERYELLTEILTEELLFMLSASIIKARRPYSFDVYRDAGVPTIDFGRAPIDPGSGPGPEELEIGKFTAFMISNAAPAVDPLWGSLAAGTLDFVLYKIDP